MLTSFFIFSLTRYVKKLLEIAFNLFQRSQQQRFLLHCYIHPWSGFTISITVGFFWFSFFLHSTIQQPMKNTGVQVCRWIRTDWFSVCISLYRNRAPLLPELKHQFCYLTIWMTSLGQWGRIFEIKNVMDSLGHVISVHARAWLTFKFRKAKWLLAWV